MLNSISALNYRSDLVKGSQQLASAKHLSKLWNTYVLENTVSQVELNHIAPNLCSACRRDKPCHTFSSRIQDAEDGRRLDVDFDNLEEDILQLSRCRTVMEELNSVEKKYIENPNVVPCKKFKYFILINILNKLI